MYHAIGVLILLIGIIVLIKYIMRTSESKASCSIDNKFSPADKEKNEDEVLEIDIKNQK